MSLVSDSCASFCSWGKTRNRSGEEVMQVSLLMFDICEQQWSKQDPDSTLRCRESDLCVESGKCNHSGGKLQPLLNTSSFFSTIYSYSPKQLSRATLAAELLNQNCEEPSMVQVWSSGTWLLWGRRTKFTYSVLILLPGLWTLTLTICNIFLLSSELLSVFYITQQWFNLHLMELLHSAFLGKWCIGIKKILK